MAYSSATLFVILLFTLSSVAEGSIADTTCGIIWDEPILLSDTTRDAYVPKIALTGDDTVHIVWESHYTVARLPYVRSTDGGETFESVRDLLTDTVAFPYDANWIQMVSSGSRVFVFFQGGTGGAVALTPIWMMSSTDGGTVWSDVVGISDTVGILQSASIMNNDLAVIGSFRPERKIVRSSDGGETWTMTNETLSDWSQLALTPGALHLVQERLGGPSEVEYRMSRDLGTTWDHNSILSTVDGISSNMPFIASHEDSVVLVAWRDAKFGCSAFVGCGILVKVGMVGSDSTRWEPERALTTIPRGFNPHPVVTSTRRAVGWVDEVVTFTTFHAALRFTGSSDTTWCPLVDLTPATSYTVASVNIAVSRNSVHVVTEQSVAPDPSTFRIFYRRGRFVTTDVEEQWMELPLRITLAQNYPNPFNPLTRIEFKISKATFVTLRAFDLLGREVATLVDGFKDGGNHSVEWSAEHLPSGIYFYRLIADNRVETKKAVLMR